MTNKALTYAEETLGVHKIYEILGQHVEDLDVATSDLDKALDWKRELEEKYADREVELISEKRGIHPDISDTRFRQDMKTWERQDPALSQLRIDLNTVKGEIQGIEFDISLTKTRIQVGSARLVELGGYLNYLAVVKNQAENTTQEKTV